MTGMWFLLSIVALLMQTTRRSAEKKAAKNVDSMAMAWLQQAVGMPFIILTLFLAKFYWPSELSSHFWGLLVVYVICSSIDVYCYFKAISIADISYVGAIKSASVRSDWCIFLQRKSRAVAVDRSCNHCARPDRYCVQLDKQGRE
jgi:uncharacterized membrane protein